MQNYGKAVTRNVLFPLLILFFYWAAFLSVDAEPYVDTHGHLSGTPSTATFNAAAATAVTAMDSAGVTRSFIGPYPFANDDADAGNRYDCDDLASVSQIYPSRFSFLCGGSNLNIMIQQNVTSGTIVDTQTFKTEARALAQTPGFIGFGELAALHFCRHSNQPFIQAPPNHYLFKALTDVASEVNAPISIHMEIVTATIAFPTLDTGPCSANPSTLTANNSQFEELLDYAAGKNPLVSIVWEHVGWDNTGARTPALVSDLLARHSNLFMSIKISTSNSASDSQILDSSFTVKTAWTNIFEAYPGHFFIGADAKFSSMGDPSSNFRYFTETWNILSQMPPSLQASIGYENAINVYHLTSTTAAWSTPRIYPNPFRPSQGHRTITLTGIKAASRVGIYTIIGERLVNLTADSNGNATWDGRNASGETVASGLYLIETTAASGQKKIVKLAIQR